MSPSLEPSLAPGLSFGPYRIERVLGEGGMGVVYEATHVGLERRVALKTLRSELAAGDDARARFTREARAAAGLRHPHVVDVYDVGTQDGVAYLAMELLDGESLSARLERDRAIDVTALADIMLPVCSAVGAAHAAGIVHRDLKPDNIFLARTRPGVVHPKLLDFGIARRNEGASPGLTQTGALLGTPNYMSPEQVEASKGVDGRSDQYSLGVILYECATGALPFDGETLYKLLHAICSGPVTPPRVHRPDLPAAFEAIILRAMARDPAARFASVHDLGRALFSFASATGRVLWSSEFGGDAPPDAQRVMPTVERPASQEGAQASTLSPVQTGVRAPTAARRAPLLAAVAAMVLTAVAIAGWRSSRAPVPERAAAAPLPATPVTQILPPPEAPPPIAAPQVPTVDAALAPAPLAAVASAPVTPTRRAPRSRTRRTAHDEAPPSAAPPSPRGTNGIPF